MPAGGYRQGCGRKKGQPTKTISFRVPEQVAEMVKQMRGGDLTIKICELITAEGERRLTAG